jgi:hypothetical protein
LRPFGEPFARHDGGDAGRIDHERGGGDAATEGIDRQIIDVIANQIARRIVWRHRDLGQVSGQELFRLERADVGVTEEAVHLGAEIAQAHAGIARRSAPIELGNHLFEQRVVVMQFFERDEAAIRVPALLASTPGVSRNSSELRSFFSATMRFSRRYCATTGAGMPWSV